MRRCLHVGHVTRQYVPLIRRHGSDTRLLLSGRASRPTFSSWKITDKDVTAKSTIRNDFHDLREVGLKIWSTITTGTYRLRTDNARTNEVERMTFSAIFVVVRHTFKARGVYLKNNVSVLETLCPFDWACFQSRFIISTSTKRVI